MELSRGMEGSGEVFSPEGKGPSPDPDRTSAAAVAQAAAFLFSRHSHPPVLKNEYGGGMRDLSCVASRDPGLQKK